MDSVTAFRSEVRSDGASESNTLSRGLGWFSLALGLGELAMPRTLARLIGVDPDGFTPVILRAMGAREIAAGAGVLLQPRRPLPLWARVAGDIVDLSLLGLAAGTKRTGGARLLGAVAAVAGVTALDVIAARRTQRAYDEANQPVVYSVTINKPPKEVYQFYRRFSQLPLFMEYLEAVHETQARRSHWVAKLPLGRTVEWDAEITDDVPGELIAWKSLAGAAVKTSRRVTFAKTPGRNMTEVRVEMQLGFLGTNPSAMLAKLFTKPQIKADLRRLKQVLETGEVLYSDASVHRGKHPAQPSQPSRETTGSQAHAGSLPFPLVAPTAQKGVTP